MINENLATSTQILVLNLVHNMETTMEKGR